MNRTTIAVAIAAAAGANLALRVRRSDAAARSRPEARTLLKDTASWNRVPNAAYILSGELTVQDQAAGTSATFRAGQASRSRSVPCIAAWWAGGPSR